MRNLLLTCLTAAALGNPAASAALNIPSDGSDGELVITANTEIDLSQAPTGNWDANNSANAGKGIYDPAKWAVVFKYSAVTVNAGATVTFKNHPSYAPVVWLVSGDVTINGAVNLSGNNGAVAPWLATAGPGGFRGGAGWLVGSAGSSAGFGVGGGATYPGHDWGSPGSYGTVGRDGPPTYGNPSVIPLIGGSGSGGDANDPMGGGAGGGAILVASSSTITLGSSGAVRANGGLSGGQSASSGSGGAIRLVCERLAGAGKLEALGGAETGGGAATAARGASAWSGSSMRSPPPSHPTPAFLYSLKARHP